MTQVSDEILAQLGGNKFLAMTGARHLLGSHNGLKFRLPGTKDFVKDGINWIGVSLNPKDLYDIEFMKVRGTKCVLIKVVNDVSVETLQSVFTEVTGLQTHL